MDWAELLLIILSVILIIFLVIATTLLIMLVMITRKIKRIADTASSSMMGIAAGLRGSRQLFDPQWLLQSVMKAIIRRK